MTGSTRLELPCFKLLVQRGPPRGAERKLHLRHFWHFWHQAFLARAVPTPPGPDWLKCFIRCSARSHWRVKRYGELVTHPVVVSTWQGSGLAPSHQMWLPCIPLPSPPWLRPPSSADSSEGRMRAAGNEQVFNPLSRPSWRRGPGDSVAWSRFAGSWCSTAPPRQHRQNPSSLLLL